MVSIQHSKAIPQAAIYVFGALAELLFGYDTGVIGVALLFMKQEMVLTPALQGLVVSSLLLGAAIGVGIAGRLADLFGRRPMIFVTGVVFAVGGIGAYLSPGVSALIASRVVMGVGVGASASVVSVYLVELAPAKHRGSIGALGQFMLVLGILLAYVVGYALTPARAWRLMLGISSVPAAILSIGVLFLPETPRWLVLHGRTDEAGDVLHRLGRGASATGELNKIVSGLEHSMPTSGLGSTLRAMFDTRLRRALIGAVGLAVLVQLVGVNSIIYYTPSTLVRAGFGNAAAVTANLAIGISNVLFTLLGISVVDKLRRKTLLMIGCAGMGVAMLALAVISVSMSASTASAALTLSCMLVFLASFAATWGVCVRVVISELFPASIRGSATGLVLVLNWIANFMVSQAFPVVAERSPAMSFLFFGMVTVFALWFVWKHLPETGNHALEDV
ncbi:sugar porter family MFS transporter [Paraburkholderia xenovorans]